MRMSDVRVGMRLRPAFGGGEDVVVTEITDRGFKYRLLEGPRILHHRLGWVLEADGHEHYGYEGESFYEEVEG